MTAKGGATSGGVQVARLKNGRVRASIPIAPTPVATVPAPAAQPTAVASGLATLKRRLASTRHKASLH
ncbi:hypothetical protein ACRAWD_08215 [Caulobacter segnis]